MNRFAVEGANHPAGRPRVDLRFAHPSERLFADLLSLYGVSWLYEPMEFPLAWDESGRPTRGFRPDFYLVDQRAFVELTVADQRLVTRKNRKVLTFRQLYPEIALTVVYQRDFRALVARHGMDPGIVIAA